MPETEKTSGKYRAPALEKGLDVLELLASAKTPMTLSQISARLTRSVSELFRMVQVLEARGYVGLSPAGDGFELTNKLFSLGISRGPSQNLLASALPLMQALSEDTRQACHLAIVSDDRMVVIARVEAPGDLGFSVRIGYQRPLAHSTSGLVIYAFQKPKIREQWRAFLRPGLTQEEWAVFETQSERALAQGHFTAKSEYIDGIIDLSCPIANDAGVIAALTMPYIHVHDGLTQSEALARLKATGQLLSKALGG
ncbi:IclR family transcriptional regulator [Asticcacaulis sp. EMRT-3]|uniref:IclR family transcriptional regulator n=1 Tax=Asticcacaulis sp. EMRT-3 TaxID=3040349 RepID=UPI0024AEE035|nr:IclR family transcriptional regulator [Asticcacaulis sp. EMRT-3]MDI7775295.1 IclR family transcriptional regulator [Asticcacaulis sp. EMRT-3]